MATSTLSLISATGTSTSSAFPASTSSSTSSSVSSSGGLSLQAKIWIGIGSGVVACIILGWIKQLVKRSEAARKERAQIQLNREEILELEYRRQRDFATGANSQPQMQFSRAERAELEYLRRMEAENLASRDQDPNAHAQGQRGWDGSSEMDEVSALQPLQPLPRRPPESTAGSFASRLHSLRRGGHRHAPRTTDDTESQAPPPTYEASQSNRYSYQPSNVGTSNFGGMGR